VLRIVFSNRYEALEEVLLATLAAPPDSPFAAVEIIVPSLAVRRRVELAIADRFGICANVRFSFLGQWLWRQIGHVVAVPELSPFETPVLAWRVLAILDDPAFAAEHPPLARYVREADAVMRYELALATATMLEQYLTYRPDWLATWLEGREVGALPETSRADERWQAALWRRIARDLGADSRHPSIAFFDAMSAMGSDAPARAGLPTAAHLFCLPATPPLYLEILRRLAAWIDLALYMPNPCREYWYDIVDARRLSWLAARDQDAYRDIGNRLLSAWGKQTQSHIDLLIDSDGIASVDDAAFAPSDRASLLARIQNAILDLTELDRGNVALAADDRTIEVHVCHSLTRELEVLQDQLLACFAGANPPRPSDILVVAPDLDSAAPLIDAVFGNVPDKLRIPYAITGRPESGQNRAAQALLALLAVATSRFAASAVFDLLQQPIIGRRFGVGATELAAIHDWIHVSGIRWGLDARHRSALGLPAFERASFRDGLDRLFLGYALPDATMEPLHGMLGTGNAEGSEAPALGAFDAFVRELERLRGDVRQPKTAPAWRQTLLATIDAFFAPIAEEIDGVRALVADVQRLHGDMANAAIVDRLPVDVIRAALTRVIDDPARGGVPGGAVTFAAMASLRGLPYRIVCVLGMNDGAFPTLQRPREFDLMALAPRRGDRQRRIDERNVFLDLLLAARDRLYLSFTGRSIRDNAPLPPSVLVAELLDYAANAIATPAGGDAALREARARLTVEHPLQPFSPDYFVVGKDARRRSFNDEYASALEAGAAADAAATAAMSEVTDRPSLADANEDDEDASAWDPQESLFVPPLAAPGVELREVTLENLKWFFANPCRYLLEARLGIRPPSAALELQDDEAFVCEYPARAALAARVLPRLLEGVAVADLRDIAVASAEYPPGRLGEIELDLELNRIAAFAALLKPAFDAPRLDPLRAAIDFDLDGEGWRIEGEIGDLRADGCVRFRYADVFATDYLSGWIEHLFLNALRPSGVHAQMQWHSRDGRYRMLPLPEAREHLDTLLRLYRRGLSRPLHFFPKASWAYASNDRNLSKAIDAWLTTPYRRWGEDRDPAYRMALRGVADPLDDDFADCAVAVFDPLLAVIVDPRVKPGGA